MKIKITLTTDDGKTYEGEIDLNKNITNTKQNVKNVKNKDNFKGTMGGLRLLIEKGFLNSPKLVKEIISELNKEGYYGNLSTVDKLLRVDLTNKKIITRIKENNVWLYVIRK